MTSRRGARALLTAIPLALGVLPAASMAQVYLNDTPQYVLSGDAIASYRGTWEGVGDRLLATHQLSEGLSLSLSGWLYESRYVKFETHLMVLRFDTFGPVRGKGYSLGYGASVLLFSRSILPITLDYAQGVAISTSNLMPSAATSTQMLQATAQLVSPTLPRAEVRAQHFTYQGVDGSQNVNDAVTATVYGTSAVNRYSGLASWQSQQFGTEPRTTTTLAALSDDAYLSRNTLATFNSSLSRSTGFGTLTDAFTSYAAAGALLTQLSPSTVVRGQYGYTMNTAPDRQESANQATLGSTINLKPIPILLGDGMAATQTTYVAPGLNETVNAVSGSQGVATSGRWGAVGAGLSGSGQLGYSTVSDGPSGLMYGYGLTGQLQLSIPRAPLTASAFYSDRVDHSAAGDSMRTYGTIASSDVSLFYPLFLEPLVSYTHIEENAFFAVLPTPIGITPPAATPLPPTLNTFAENDTLTATLTGTSPLWRTRLSFAGGYVDSSSTSEGQTVHLSQAFGRVADAFRLGAGTFGNLEVDATHEFGQGSVLSALASLVWSFRASSLTATYNYTVSYPGGFVTHALALLFTRSFGTSFLPESR